MLQNSFAKKLDDNTPRMEHRFDYDLEPKAEFKRRADKHRAAMTLVMTKKIPNEEFRRSSIGQEVMSRSEIIDWTRRARLFLERLDTGQYTTVEAYGMGMYLHREVGYHTYADYDKKTFEATDEPYDPNDEVMNDFSRLGGRIIDILVTIRVDHTTTNATRASPWDLDR